MQVHRDITSGNVLLTAVDANGAKQAGRLRAKARPRQHAARLQGVGGQLGRMYPACHPCITHVSTCLTCASRAFACYGASAGYADAGWGMYG